MHIYVVHNKSFVAWSVLPFGPSASHLGDLQQNIDGKHYVRLNQGVSKTTEFLSLSAGLSQDYLSL